MKKFIILFFALFFGFVSGVKAENADTHTITCSYKSESLVNYENEKDLRFFLTISYFGETVWQNSYSYFSSQDYEYYLLNEQTNTKTIHSSDGAGDFIGKAVINYDSDITFEKYIKPYGYEYYYNTLRVVNSYGTFNKGILDLKSLNSKTLCPEKIFATTYVDDLDGRKYLFYGCGNLKSADGVEYNTCAQMEKAFRSYNEIQLGNNTIVALSKYDDNSIYIPEKDENGEVISEIDSIKSNFNEIVNEYLTYCNLERMTYDYSTCVNYKTKIDGLVQAAVTIGGSREDLTVDILKIKNEEKTKYCDQEKEEYDEKKCAIVEYDIKLINGTDVNIQTPEECYKEAEKKSFQYCDNESSDFDKEKCEEANKEMKACLIAGQENINTGIDIDFDTNGCDSYLGNPENKGEPAYYLQFVFNLIKYAAIILLFVLSIVDFAKAVTSDKDDAIKKSSINAVKRLALVIIIFFLPILIEFVLTLLGIYSATTCGIK